MEEAASRNFESASFMDVDIVKVEEDLRIPSSTS